MEDQTTIADQVHRLAKRYARRENASVSQGRQLVRERFPLKHLVSPPPADDLHRIGPGQWRLYLWVLFDTYAPGTVGDLSFPEAAEQTGALFVRTEEVFYVGSRSLRIFGDGENRQTINIRFKVMGFEPETLPRYHMKWTGERAGWVRAVISKSKLGLWAHRQWMFLNGYYLPFVDLARFIEYLKQRLETRTLERDATYRNMVKATRAEAPAWLCEDNPAFEKWKMSPSEVKRMQVADIRQMLT